MRKLVALGALALVALSFIPAHGQAVWKSVDLPIRTNAAAYASPGYRDSVTASLGLANTIDTTGVFAPSDWARGLGIADSLQYIAVQVIPTAALAAGESLYVALMGGSGGRDLAWTDTYGCGPATSAPGGFVAAASVITEGGQVAFGGGNCGSGTSGGVTYPVAAAAKLIYGGWGPYPALRVKVETDASASVTDNSYRVRIWYWAKP